MRQQFRVIDAHVAGAPVRLLLEGVPTPSGPTLERRRRWLERHADHVRRATIAEPRGRRDLVGVLFTEPTSPGADAGMLFMDAAGYPMLNGAGIMAAVTIALERGLITKSDAGATKGNREVQLTFDTPAGPVISHARLDTSNGRMRVTSVRVTGVPSFVARAHCAVTVGTRRLAVDLAFGGAFYAIVDSESVGIPLTLERLADLRRLGADICRALEGHEALVHPGDSTAATIGGVIFTSQPESAGAHLRSVTVVAHGACDRSPGVTGTSAVMAVLTAMGLLREGDDLVNEGLLGVAQRGSVSRSLEVNGLPAVIPEIEGTAWITGEQTLFVEDEDPLKDGFSL